MPVKTDGGGRARPIAGIFHDSDAAAHGAQAASDNAAKCMTCAAHNAYSPGSVIVNDNMILIFMLNSANNPPRDGRNSN